MWQSMALGVVVAALIGIAFVGGCFCGSWVQRSIGYIIRSRIDKECLDQASDRAEKDYEGRRTGNFQDERPARASEAMHNLARSTVNNPLGAGIPSPEDLDRLINANPNDFTKNLSTEQMREALRNG